MNTNIKNKENLKFREHFSEDTINIGLDIGGSLCKLAIVVHNNSFNLFKLLIIEKYNNKYLDDFTSTFYYVKKLRK